jgi:hypothetical protein
MRKSQKPLARNIEFECEATEKAFTFLIHAFEEDYVKRRLPQEKSGWRTLMEIVRNAQVSKHSMYGQSGRGGEVPSELGDLGLVESRFFNGERGRGGHVLKIRICNKKLTETANVQKTTD